MGSIVAGLFSTHVPRLMILDPEKRREYMKSTVTSFYDVLPQIREERIAPLDFDTFVIIDTHWHSTLEWILNAHARHEGIYTSDEIPWMINEYAYDYPGDPELAEAIAAECRAEHVWAEASAHRGLPVHYGTLNIMHYYNPGPHKKRVLPISVCDTAEVEANLAFGAALARAVAASDRRVLLVASGGMSHRFWPLAVIRERASADPERHQRRQPARMGRADHGLVAGGRPRQRPRARRRVPQGVRARRAVRALPDPGGRARRSRLDRPRSPIREL
jgi:3,4-dihydroxyphenylacetate 2,3-dioxygenase